MHVTKRDHFSHEVVQPSTAFLGTGPRSSRPRQRRQRPRRRRPTATLHTPPQPSPCLNPVSVMYQPRKSILQMFDPLMANPPSTPRREESNASPDNSDKENDAPHDPLSLTQYFNRTYHVESLQKPATPKGKLIDFGDLSIDEDDEFAIPGPSAVATEMQPDDRDSLLSTPFMVDPQEESDTENATSPPSDGPFTTPQNRRILGDIDVDALQPPKPPVKQGALKISFLTAVNGGSPPAEASMSNAPSSDPAPDSAVLGPVITLYPPTFDSIPPTSSAPQISDKVEDYLSPQPPLLRTAAHFTPRRSPLSSQHPSNRISMDLQSSFQLQLQSADYSFNLVNDKVSFLESSQELSFPEPDDDSDMDDIVEDDSLDDMLKSLTLQDKVSVPAKRNVSPTSEKFAITSIPEKDSGCKCSSYDQICVFSPYNTQHTPNLRRHEPSALSRFHRLKVCFVQSWHGPFSDPKLDLPEAKSTTAVSNVVKKPAGSIRRPSLARPPISRLQPVLNASKPPMRVLLPPSKRPCSTTATQRTSLVRPPARQSLTTGSLPKPAVATTKIVGKPTDGPRRVLVHASDKPTPRVASTSITPAPKAHGPQRVLVRTTSGTTNPMKKPLGPSSSINPPASTSRLPGPSRIAVPSTLKTMARTSNISKPAGRLV